MTHEQPGREPDRPDWQPPAPPPMPPPPEYGGQGYGTGYGYGGGDGPGGPGYAGGPGYGGPPYAGGPRYGGFQPMGQPPEPPAPVPSTLDTAWWLVVANVVLSLVGMVYTLTHRDEIIDQIISTRSVDPELARSAANVGIAVGVVFGLGFAVFFLSLGIIGGLANIAGTNPSFSKLLGGVGLLVDIAALVLIWLRPSNEYIAARNRTW
jgi:hypothetical protein